LPSTVTYQQKKVHNAIYKLTGCYLKSYCAPSKINQMSRGAPPENGSVDKGLGNNYFSKTTKTYDLKTAMARIRRTISGARARRAVAETIRKLTETHETRIPDGRGCTDGER